MEEKRRKLRQKVILTTTGVVLFNLILSVTLTNVTPDQTGTQSTYWHEIFIYARQFSVLLYAAYLMSLFEKTADFWKRAVSFLMGHMNVIFLCVIFGYLALYEVYCAYFASSFISPDSSGYMREASALLAGNGFRWDKLAGYNDSWFSSWPIGYPALIAAATFLSGRSIYLSSKLLSIALVGLGLLVLYLRFRKDAWLFSLIYLNIGFLVIYGYTWSENPFILSLIVWGVSLSAIVEKTSPAKYWYVLVGLGILCAFLSRYFGIVTILFTGVCLFLYLCSYIVRRNTSVLPKIRGLFFVELISTIAAGSYLCMNYVMGGNLTGGGRLGWRDDYNELIKDLYDALVKEIFNATRVDIVSLMPDFYPQGKAAVILLFLSVLAVVLLKNFLKEKKIDYKTVFIGAGVFYYLTFIVVRFYSSMDTFSFRFFAPAGMMVSIGVLGLIKDRWGDRMQKFRIVLCLFLFLLCGGLVQKIKYCTVETSAYHIFYDQLTEPVEPIPSTGMVLHYDGDYRLYAFRPDIMINGYVAHDDTMEMIASRYDRSDSIWIRRGVLNAIVADENYSDDIRNAFLQFVIEGADEGEYVRVR